MTTVETIIDRANKATQVKTLAQMLQNAQNLAAQYTDFKTKLKAAVVDPATVLLLADLAEPFTAEVNAL